MFIQPETVLPVYALNVLDKQFAQEAEQWAHLDLFAVPHAMGGLQDLRQNALVIATVFGKARKAVLLQQLLLTPEVHAGELDQPVQNFADPFASGTTHRYPAQLVQRIQQDAVLVVHCPYAYSASSI
jgi:hypothetical protein